MLLVPVTLGAFTGSQLTANDTLARDPGNNVCYVQQLCGNDPVVHLELTTKTRHLKNENRWGAGQLYTT